MGGAGFITRISGASWVLLAGVGLLHSRGTQDWPNQVRAADLSSEYVVRSWTTEEGLPQNTVKALVQTRDGYIWLGTLKGLVRFDGVRFTVFDYNNTPALPDDSINDLAEDQKSDCLWISTESGLLCYHNHHFRAFGASHGIPGSVGVLRAARDGGVWFSPEQGKIGLAREGEFKVWEFGPARPETTVQQILEEGATQLLVLIYNRPCHFDLGSGLLSPIMIRAEEARHLSLCQDNRGSVWLCRADGLWRKAGARWERIVAADPHRLPWPEWVYATGEGQMWVAERTGACATLHRYSNGGLSRFGAEHLPDDLDVNRLLEDHEGNLWIGSGTGLYRLSPRRIKVYSKRDGLRNDEVQAVTQGHDGTIWLGTEEGISGLRDGQVFDVSGTNWDPVSKKVGTLLADSQDRLWLPTQTSGLDAYVKGRWRPVLWSRLLEPLGNIQCLAEDNARRIWLGTQYGILRQESKEGTFLPVTNGLPQSDVRVIHQDRRGTMWFGTYGGGLIRLQDERFTAFTTTRGQHNNRAWWIHEDADGIFWVGTEAGLNRFVPPGVAADVRRLTSASGKQKGYTRNDQSLRTSAASGEVEGRFFTFTMQQGLGENVVNNVQEDDFGYLWLSGLRGIYRIPKQELNEVAAGRRAEVQCAAYGEADGMLISECNGGEIQPAGCKDRQGRIWFPTLKGVAVVDPRQFQRHSVAPPVVIEQVKANDQVVWGDGWLAAATDHAVEPRHSALEGRSPAPPKRSFSLELGPGRGRVLEIHYTANTFVASERTRFAYKLEGHDKSWSEDTSNRRTAIYTDLRPGRYRFRVRAFTSHGVASAQDAEFAFSLAPWFYQTWPFYVLCGSALLGLTTGVHLLRMNGLRRIKHLEQQHALELERTRIARDMHDSLAADLTRIAVLADMAQRQPAQAADPAQWGKAGDLARGLVDGIGELIWATNPRNNSLDTLAAYLRAYASEFLEATGLLCRFDFPDEVPPLPMSGETRRHLFLAAKEALSNVVKHARASQITFRLEVPNRQVQISVEDNGCGFAAQPDLGEPSVKLRLSGGNGLRNLQDRLAAIGGQCVIQSTPGSGTRICLTVPLEHLPARGNGH